MRVVLTLELLHFIQHDTSHLATLTFKSSTYRLTSGSLSTDITARNTRRGGRLAAAAVDPRDAAAEPRSAEAEEADEEEDAMCARGVEELVREREGTDDTDGRDAAELFAEDAELDAEEEFEEGTGLCRFGGGGAMIRRQRQRRRCGGGVGQCSLMRPVEERST